MNRIALINDYPKLALRYNTWKKLQKVTHNSFAALFSTKAHKRRVIRRDRMAQRFCAEVRKEFCITEWDIKMFHDHRSVNDVGPLIVWHHG